VVKKHSVSLHSFINPNYRGDLKVPSLVFNKVRTDESK
jgi:hypothetical protein